MLDRYFAILNGERSPYYIKAKENCLLSDLEDKTSDELFKMHDGELKDGVPSLDLKIEIADRILENCVFCERQCGVNRKKAESGYCGVLRSKISSEFLHFGEESELVPSHTIFFSGCNFHCVYCQNWDISQNPNGKRIPPELMAEIIQGTNAKNVNWVGGDPTPNLYYILRVLEHLDKNTPQIWNSSMYLSEEGMKLLAKLMDVYLTDFKYGNDGCAKRLSDVEDYTDVLKRNHLIAEETGDLIIRHLVLPNHIECCTKPILEWIDENLEDPMVNIMSQYRPMYRAKEHDDINRYLNEEEEKEIERLRKEYSHLTGY